MGDGLIINRVFGYAPDQALVLRAGEFARQIIYGGGWSRIRIGLLFALQRSSSLGVANQTGSLFFGMGQWGSPVSKLATTNFLGISLIGNAAPGSTHLLTYVAGSSGNDYYTPTAGQLFAKYGTNYINYGGLTAGAYLPLTLDSTLVASLNRRAVLIVDITRSRGGSGSGNISVYCTTTAQVGQDFRADNMFDAMDRTGTPTLLGTAMTVLANAVAVQSGEEFGALDSLMVYWSRAALPLEIYAVGGNVLFDSDYAAATTPGNQGGAYANFEGYGTRLTTGLVQNTSGSFLTTVPETGTLIPNVGFGTFIASGSADLLVSPNPYSIAVTDFATAFYGTECGWPREDFSTYGTGTATSSRVLSGIGFVSYGTFYGTSNSGARSATGFSGTSSSWPQEDFNVYSTGTIGSPVVLSAGTGWQSYGTIYT